MAKNIFELSREEFDKLKESGLLKTIYPEFEGENFEDIYPKKLDNIDWSSVISMAEEHLKDVAKNEERDDDDHYFYEEVMKAVFGKDIFSKFINKYSV